VLDNQKDDKQTAQIDAQLVAVTLELNATVDAARVWLAAQALVADRHPSTSAGESTAADSQDNTLSAGQVTLLLQMLHEQNYEACNLYAQLRNCLASRSTSGLRSLDDAIERLDFMHARTLLLLIPGIGTLAGISAG